MTYDFTSMWNLKTKQNKNKNKNKLTDTENRLVVARGGVGGGPNGSRGSEGKNFQLQNK